MKKKKTQTNQTKMPEASKNIIKNWRITFAMFQHEIE